MGQITKTEVCKCKHCGNEAEMHITCTLPEPENEAASKAAPGQEPLKVKGTATCTVCGNEADMWLDL